jgi:hypothetical protein
MKNRFLMIISALLLLSAWGCKLESNQPVREIYFFEKSLKLGTVKKQYSTGDIFWVEASLPGKTLKDQQTGADILIRNATFNVTAKLDILSIEPFPVSIDRFDIFVQSGEASRDDLFPQNGEALLGYGCPDNSYNLRVGFQLKQRGNYVFMLNPERVVSLIFFSDSDDCAIQDIFPPPVEADLGNVFYTFDIEDNNLDVFDEITEGMADDQTIANYRQALEQKRAFFISVR